MNRIKKHCATCGTEETKAKIDVAALCGGLKCWSVGISLTLIPLAAAWYVLWNML